MKTKLLAQMTLACRKCQHRWFPRRPEKPKTCPHCKTYKWEKKGKRYE